MMPNLPPRTKLQIVEISEDCQIELWQLIAFENPMAGTLDLARVVGLPRERIWLDHHGIRVDGNARRPPFPNISYRIQNTDFKFANGTYYKIPENEYFVLFDNLDFENDSRNFGTLNCDKISGTLTLGN